jgi:hypothetical protein
LPKASLFAFCLRADDLSEHARKNRLDVSVGIALGSAFSNSALRRPGSGDSRLRDRSCPDESGFWPGVVVMMLVSTMAAGLGHEQRALDVVCWSAHAYGVLDFCNDALPSAAENFSKRT